MNLSLLHHVLTAVLRDRLIVSLLLIFIVSASISIFLGSTAVIEKDQFALVFAAFSMRLAGVAGLVLFVTSFIRRSFDARDIDFLLSRPIGRGEFLFSYGAAFVLIALVMGIIQGGALYLISPHLFGEGHVLWTLSMIAENMIMALVALFFAMVLGSVAVSAMACLGFYVLARMMGQILGVIDSSPDFFASAILSPIMQAISVVLPRLDLMAQSSWLVYGVESGVGVPFIILQLMTFATLIFTAALIDLVRRDF